MEIVDGARTSPFAMASCSSARVNQRSEAISASSAAKSRLGATA